MIDRKISNSKRAVCLMICCIVFATSGCNRFYTDYGTSKNTVGRTSVNGFGGLRSMFEQDGFKTRDISRLTDRVRRTDVIVWTPREIGAIESRSTRWFENWLSGGNRTLVYVVPDSGSETEYWQDAASLAPPELRLEYRKRIAKSVNQRMAWRSNRSAPPSNGWFRVNPLAGGYVLNDVEGKWDVPTTEGDELSNKRIEFGIEPFEKDATASTTVAPGGMFMAGRPTGPSAQGWVMMNETAPTKTETKFRTMLKSSSDQVIVASIQSKRWKGSQVVVVAGGSLLTNYALTKQFGNELATEMVAQVKEPLANSPASDGLPSVGFLTTGVERLPVSERKPGAPVASGMELLTVWPISLVTMHGVLLGLVVCLMLFPIFGRPRKGKEVELSDFDDHLDSVAALMKRAGGEHFAKHQISEYQKRIRGESSGPWILDQEALDDRAKVTATPTNSGQPNSLK